MHLLVWAVKLFFLINKKFIKFMKIFLTTIVMMVISFIANAQDCNQGAWLELKMLQKVFNPTSYDSDGVITTNQNYAIDSNTIKQLQTVVIDSEESSENWIAINMIYFWTQSPETTAEKALHAWADSLLAKAEKNLDTCSFETMETSHIIESLLYEWQHPLVEKREVGVPGSGSYITKVKQNKRFVSLYNEMTRRMLQRENTRGYMFKKPEISLNNASNAELAQLDKWYQQQELFFENTEIIMERMNVQMAMLQKNMTMNTFSSLSQRGEIIKKFLRHLRFPKQ